MSLPEVIELEVDIEKETSVINSWQSIPLPIVAVTWNSKEFRQEFIKDPRFILKELTPDFPNDLFFCVLENTKDVINLVIPYRNPDTYGWDKNKLKNRIESEISYDVSTLEYGMPKDIILQAMIDMDFRNKLISNPKAILKEEGYIVNDDIQYFVHENTPYTSHLLIPYNKWNEYNLTTEQLEINLAEDLKKTILH